MCTARSSLPCTGLRFSAIPWPPTSQPGKGFMFLPDSLRPRGNSLSSQRAVRCCSFPTAGDGFTARRPTARDESCSSVSPTPVLPRTGRPVCNPSIWSRSTRGSPRAVRRRSSLIDVIGSTQLVTGTRFRKMSSGTERKETTAWNCALVPTRPALACRRIFPTFLYVSTTSSAGGSGESASWKQDSCELSRRKLSRAPNDSSESRLKFNKPDRQVANVSCEAEGLCNPAIEDDVLGPRLTRFRFFLDLFLDASTSRLFTLPFANTRRLKSIGESSAARPVAVSSAYVRRQSPRAAAITVARRCC
mmetsp:Transcript_57103/g.169794  ORF Transcript_57103/g.169794 Transcript_57103/m.169794 type:complete len:304 (+) Transcript_57103:93-1004(+)